MIKQVKNKIKNGKGNTKPDNKQIFHLLSGYSKFQLHEFFDHKRLLHGMT
jgi:hypothetical protein